MCLEIKVSIYDCYRVIKKSIDVEPLISKHVTIFFSIYEKKYLIV